MFTGIIHHVAGVKQAGRKLILEKISGISFTEGESVCVNGCCLTHLGGGSPTFDLSDETLSRTNLGDLTEDSKLNIERCLRVGDALGGHFVSGHVDAVGFFLWKKEGASGWEFRFRNPIEGAKYIADKGSIAINGVSLTIVNPSESEFSVWVVPFTYEHTNLGMLEKNDKVNIEYDMLAKYLESLIMKK